MPDDTDILGLPLILPNQAQKHVTHNEALLALDVLVQLAVITRDQTVPPALASIGDRHIVPTGATLDWAGQAGRVAVLTETGWQFHNPNPGWQAYVLADAEVAVFDGVTWNAASEGAATFAQLGVSTSPDATNRLAVSSPATLLNHAGAGHQLKLNKATAGDTASLLFQTGFSGRAEMGTAGSDAFAVKVSADGSAWSTAFAADPLSGKVTFPAPVLLGGQATDPASPPNGALWLNTTSGEVKVRTGGATVVVGAGGGGGVSDGDKGDITVSGGGATWTVDAGAISLAKLANVATGTLFYRKTGGTGAPEVQTLATLKADLGLTGTNSGDQTITLTGDVMGSGTGTISASLSSGAVTSAAMGNHVVTNAKLALMPAFSLKGNPNGSAAEPVDLSATNATALLNEFTPALKGLAPASGGGTANFLRADGTWASPGGAAPLRPWDFWTEFRAGSNNAAASEFFIGAAISSGTNTTSIPSGAGQGIAPMGVLLRSSTTANGGYRYMTSTVVGDYFGVISHKFRAGVQWKTSFTGRTVRLGFHDAVSVTDATDGAYFEIAGDLCQAKTANNATRTTHGTTITLSLDSLYVFDIDVNEAGSEARFRVWEALNPTALMDVTITTDIPTTATRTFGCGLVATDSSTTASDMVILHLLGTGTVEGFRKATGETS